jgi:hypothetical protein
MTKSLSSWTTVKENPGQMHPILDAGILWVQAWIRQLSDELGRLVDRLEWPRPLPPAGLIPVKIWRVGAYSNLSLDRDEDRRVLTLCEERSFVEA